MKFVGFLSLCLSFLSVNPQLTSECLSSLSTFTNAIQASTLVNLCISSMQSVLSNPTPCIMAGNFSLPSTFSCMNPLDILGTTKMHDPMISPPKKIPPASNVTCPFCTNTTTNSPLDDDCLNLLDYITETVAGYPPSFTDGNTNAALNAVSVDCSNLADSQLLTYLRDQSKVLCALPKTFGQQLSPIDTLVGIMDMRHLMQCGTCGVMPCLPGQYCPGNQPATQCPAGYYCPTTTFMYICPSQYYCPKSTVTPLKCRPTSIGSCTEGSQREVVWIPLFIDILLMMLLFYVTAFQPLTILKEMQGYQRLPKGIIKVDDNHSGKESVNIQSVQQNAVRIAFKDVFLTTGYTKRLRGVSGNIASNKVTAIIGGSGAGKTSLMNVLLRREEVTSGNIDFLATDTETRLPPSFVKNHVAYVPQNDVLIRSMTVSQLLYHSARSRLPNTTTEIEITNIIDNVAARLGIDHALHVQIGTSTQGSSLSMSDRKKVNIAFELVSGPQVLFLDEPTTSVDASAAMNIMEVVRELSSSGLTCVCVIHQPRGEIFNLIDNVMVLSPGGHVAYSGPAKLMVPWFEYLGFKLPHEKANRFDFAMDLTTGNYSSSDENNCIDNMMEDEDVDELSKETLFWKSWSEEGEEFLKSRGHESPIYNCEETTLKLSKYEMDNQNTRRGFIGQLSLYMHQALIGRLKYHTILQDCLNMLIGGVILGIITCGDELLILPIPQIYKRSCPPGAESICSRWQRFEIGPATFLVPMVLGAMSVPSAIRTFGREKDTFSREQAVGANKPAYFLGKCLVDMFCSFFYVFVFLAPMIAIAPWRSPTEMLYCVMLVVNACITSIGYALSFVFTNPDDAVLCATILVILINLVGGFVPTLGDGILGTLSYSKYASRAIFNTEVYYGHDITDDDLYDTIAPPSWKGRDLGRDLLNLVIITIVTLIFAYMLFEYQFRGSAVFSLHG